MRADPSLFVLVARWSKSETKKQNTIKPIDSILLLLIRPGVARALKEKIHYFCANFLTIF